MKIQIIKYWALSIISVFLFIVNASDKTKSLDSLLPEVEAILTLPPFEESWLENNLYPNFVSLGVKNASQNLKNEIIVSSYQQFQEYLGNNLPDRKRYDAIGVRGQFHLLKNKDDYWYFASDFITPEFTDNLMMREPNKEDSILKLAQSLNEEHWFYPAPYVVNNYQENINYINQYRTLLKNRGQKYFAMPNYKRRSENIDVSNHLFINQQQQLSGLLLTYATLQIEQGNVEKGLDIIEYEYDMANLILHGVSQNFYDELRYLQIIEWINHLTSRLIYEGALDNYLDHPFLEKIQKPLFVNIRELKQHLDALLQRTIEDELRKHYVLMTKDNKFIGGVLYPWGIYSIEKIKINPFMNVFYLYYQKEWDIYQNNDNKGLSHQKYEVALAELDRVYGKPIAKTYRESIEAGTSPDSVQTTEDFETFLEKSSQYRSIMNLQRVLSIQIAVKKNKIPKENIRDYLLALGDSNKDIFTDQPFEYNEDTQWLTMFYVKQQFPYESEVKLSVVLSYVEN